MKKIFTSIMFAALTTFTATAQEAKEYNMVVTLQNGTVITLGHNDIKNITFNDGQVSISGDVMSTIEGLLQDVEATQGANERSNMLISNLQAKTKEMEQAFSTFNEGIIQQNAANDDRFTTVENALATFNEGIIQQNEGNEGRFTTVENALATFNDGIIQQNEANEERFATVENALATFNDGIIQQNAANDDRFATVENALATFNDGIIQQNAANDDRFKDVENTLHTFNEGIIQQNAANEKQLTNLTNDVEALQGADERTQNVINKLFAEIAKLQEELTALKEDILIAPQNK